MIGVAVFLPRKGVHGLRRVGTRAKSRACALPRVNLGERSRLRSDRLVQRRGRQGELRN